MTSNRWTDELGPWPPEYIMVNLKLILTLKCEEATRLASDALDRRLTFSERVALRAHLLICRGCRLAAAQIRKIRQLLSNRDASESATSPSARLSADRRAAIIVQMTDESHDSSSA